MLLLSNNALSFLFYGVWCTEKQMLISVVEITHAIHLRSECESEWKYTHRLTLFLRYWFIVFTGKSSK